MPEWNLTEFQKYVRNSFSELKRALKLQQDGRESSSSDIDASQLANSFFCQVLLGKKSIHQLDQWLRHELVQDLFNLDCSHHFGSDSTLLQAADGWNLSGIRKAARATINSLTDSGDLTFSRINSSTVRPAIMDGSNFGGYNFNVLTLDGDSIQAPLDLQPHSNLGTERTAAYKILYRLINNPEPVPFTHLLLDGLYMIKNIFLLGAQMGFYPLVKTPDDNLSCSKKLQEDWDNYFDADSSPEHINIIEGKDRVRGFEYQALQNCHISWNGFTLNGLQLQITHTSGDNEGKTETWWIFTTDTDLTAEELRQLAHHRWAIENNEFKELNQLVGSKSSYIQSESKKHTILFWQMIGWALFQAFRNHCEKLLEKMAYGHTMTKRWLIAQLKLNTYQSLANAPPDED